MKAKKIEAEGSELILRNEHGDYVIIPKKHRLEVSDMVKEGCNKCIDAYIETLPIMEDYAEDGSLFPDWNKVKATLNPKNWGVTDYSDKGNFDKAYSSARQSGEKEFMWNNKRYSTDYAGTPQQQLRETGITDAEIQGISTANTTSNMLSNVGKYFLNIDDKDLKESPYIPTITVDKTYYKWYEKLKKYISYKPVQKYYTRQGFKQDVYKDLTSEDVKKNYNHSGEFEDIYTALKNNGKDREHNADKAFPKNKAGYKGIYNLGHGSFKGQFNFGRYVVDAGEDKNGRYISFSDRYDWNGIESNSKYPTYNEKGINFYDRIYENEWHRLQNKKYSNEELSQLDINKKNFDTLSLQRELANRGYKLPKSTKKDGSFDGIYGEETKTALLDYQIKNKTKNNGL